MHNHKTFLLIACCIQSSEASFPSTTGADENSTNCPEKQKIRPKKRRKLHAYENHFFKNKKKIKSLEVVVIFFYTSSLIFLKKLSSSAIEEQPRRCTTPTHT